MNFEINDLIMQFEVLKESLEDVKTKHGWFDEDYFTYEGDCVLTKDEVIRHGSAYHEHRIHSKQTFDLLRLYLNEFDRLIVNFKELDIEKKHYLLPTKAKITRKKLNCLRNFIYFNYSKNYVTYLQI